MSQRSKGPARALAVIALACGFLAVPIVIATSVGDDGEPARPAATGKAKRDAKKPKRPKRASYEVKSGDTLTSIARRTGVPLNRLEALNPGVDPQLLRSGQKLKLR